MNNFKTAKQKKKMNANNNIFGNACDIYKTAPIKENEILILGYFDRGNLGDEAFKIPYTLMYKNANIQSIESISQLPKNTKCIIIAGGDIVNNYFISKLKRLTINYTGLIYGISIGIPYPSEAFYLNIFDHVIMRAKTDIQTANNVIGSANVSYLPDITNTIIPTLKFKTNAVAFALAQPYFHKNENKPLLVASIIKTIKKIILEYPETKINLLAFNTSASEKESDLLINNEIEKHFNNLAVVESIKIKDTAEMLSFMSSQKLIICMRFHSVVFANIVNVPFVAFYTTRKIKNLLIDLDAAEKGYELETDPQYQPTHINEHKLFALIKNNINNNNDIRQPLITLEEYKEEIDKLIENKQKKYILENNILIINEEDAINSTVRYLNKYMGLPDTTLLQDAAERIKANLADATRKKDISNVIIYGATGQIGSPYLWGLMQNIAKEDFNLRETIKWIYYDNLAKQMQRYFMNVDFDRKLYINMNYMIQDNYKDLHRSGWTYVADALQNIDARNFMRDESKCVKLDICAERTFLWGKTISKLADIIPYRTPWVGVIHHTFAKEYSYYNCETLLDTPEFIESAPVCKCLIVLSVYLANQLRNALRLRSMNIPVISVMHPTDFPANTFKLHKFKQNPMKKVIQIGAWLRNTYAIYSLALSVNCLNIKKAALKGKEMDNYFMPPNLFEILENTFIDKNVNNINSCLSRELSRCVSRDNTLSKCEINNKYVLGMIDHLRDNNSSVEILDYTSNEEYDELLTKNIVYVEYIDASASNTIIECIVRNTPLIVNRHPALEEYLGGDYCGFYENETEAIAMITDIEKIEKIYWYLVNMDKTFLTIEYFMYDLQQKLAAVI